MSNDIYSYIKENFGIEITDYQFKRDYIKKPLKSHKGPVPGEKPFDEDFCYLYNTLNLRIKDLENIFSCGVRVINYMITKNNISKKPLPKKVKPNNDIYKYYNINIDYLSRDFIKYPLRTLYRSHITGGIILETPTKEDLEYLSSIPLTNPQIAEYFYVDEKTIRKWKKKFNIKKDTHKIKLMQEKAFKNKTGLNFRQYFTKKSKETKLKKYGNENYTNKEKYKQTCLEKYGTEYYLSSKNYKNLYKNEKWVKNINNKKYISFKKNNSFAKSSYEDEIYNLLIQKYSNILRQYKSELYPFPCDFYIPELDLYIEYQGTWYHGNEPYIGTDEQKEIIKKWGEKSKEINFKGELKSSYLNAIQTWTIRDPLKRETAKKNNLNWIEFFNMEQFMEWFNQLK